MIIIKYVLLFLCITHRKCTLVYYIATVYKLKLTNKAGKQYCYLFSIFVIRHESDNVTGETGISISLFTLYCSLRLGCIYFYDYKTTEFAFSRLFIINRSEKTPILGKNSFLAVQESPQIFGNARSPSHVRARIK